jgi:hypothetical protein
VSLIVRFTRAKLALNGAEQADVVDFTQNERLAVSNYD